MPWFTKSINGPEVMAIKITFENICQQLNDGLYDRGVDRDTLINTIDDMYRWMVVDPNYTIRLPATVDEPDDKSRFIFPEGARVMTRKHGGTSSVSSRASSNLPKNARKLSEHYTRSCSTTSSAHGYKSRHIGFVEDDEDDTGARTPRSPIAQKPTVHNTGRRSQVSVGDVRNVAFDMDESTEKLLPPKERQPQRRNTKTRSDGTKNRAAPGFADE